MPILKIPAPLRLAMALVVQYPHLATLIKDPPSSTTVPLPGINFFTQLLEMAQKSRENTDEMLIQLLEGRLDNVIYRLGFANSRNMARQFVSHGHVLVDGKKISIPSYNVKIGEKITLSKKLLSNEVLKLYIDESASNLLPFLERKDAVGKLAKKPERAEVPNPADYQLVIELYSR